MASRTTRWRSQLPGCFFALLLPLGVHLQASPSLTLEANVYVYSNREVRAVRLPDGIETSGIHGVVVNSPAAIGFDDETLWLDGSQFSWSGASNPPERFSLIGSPRVPVGFGQPVTFVSTVPVQYLEKLSDGTLKLREIAADSPEAPRFQLTFTVGPGGDSTGELRLTSDLDVATVRTRESIPGVALEVGKPVLARVRERVASVVREDEWSALLVPSPNGSDYSALVLLKVASEPAVDPGGGAEQTGRLMTAVELDTFVVTYYRNPRPELIARAIEALGPSGFARDRAPVFAAFFAEVFTAHPHQTEEWRRVAERRDKRTRRIVELALQLSRSGDVLATRDPEVHLNGRCWGAFFASGDPSYLRRLVEQLRLLDDNNTLLYRAGVRAMWSLFRNVPLHPLVRETLEAARPDMDARVRETIDVVLMQDPYALDRHLSGRGLGPSQNLSGHLSQPR